MIFVQKEDKSNRKYGILNAKEYFLRNHTIMKRLRVFIQYLNDLVSQRSAFVAARISLPAPHEDDLPTQRNRSYFT